MTFDRTTTQYATTSAVTAALLRVAAWSLACAGLGIVLAQPDDRAQHAVAVAGGIGAALLVAFSASAAVRWAGVAVGAAAIAADLALGGDLRSVAVAMLVVAFAGLFVSLVWDLAGLAREQEGDPGAHAQLHAARADDELVAELNRARRYERPLSLVTFSVQGRASRPLARRRAVVELAESLAGCLRQSDLVRRRGSSRLVVVLPETSGAETDLLLARIRDRLDPHLLASVRMGAASFPSEEVTWVGLERRALDRERLDGEPPFFTGSASHELPSTAARAALNGHVSVNGHHEDASAREAKGQSGKGPEPGLRAVAR